MGAASAQFQACKMRGVGFKSARAGKCYELQNCLSEMRRADVAMSLDAVRVELSVPELRGPFSDDFFWGG